MNTVGDDPWMTHPVMVASGAFWVCGGCWGGALPDP
jgi:hypothetical protein